MSTASSPACSINSPAQMMAAMTLAYLISHLEGFRPNSIKVCAMIDKKERRKAAIEVDYVCSTVEKGFLVGYGLDYAEDFRNLPEVYHMKL